MKPIEYKCMRGKRLGPWSCACRECNQRTKAEAKQLAERVMKERAQGGRCPHGVPARYSCSSCDPF